MINVGETVRVTARPFDWDGVLDEGATCYFTHAYGTENSSSIEMPYDEETQNYVGEFVPSKAGFHNVRVVATLTDGSKSVDSRKLEVKP